VYFTRNTFWHGMDLWHRCKWRYSLVPTFRIRYNRRLYSRSKKTNSAVSGSEYNMLRVNGKYGCRDIRKLTAISLWNPSSARARTPIPQTQITAARIGNRCTTRLRCRTTRHTIIVEIRYVFTASKGTSIYKPHTAYGMVGTTSAAYLGDAGDFRYLR